MSDIERLASVIADLQTTCKVLSKCIQQVIKRVEDLEKKQ
jgi:hypothetical protein